MFMAKKMYRVHRFDVKGKDVDTDLDQFLNNFDETLYRSFGGLKTDG